MTAGDLNGQVKAILFDVFGTVVDWRSSITRELAAFGVAHRIHADWDAVADDWRGEYQPAMDEVRSGRRDWTILDVLHRESLERVLARHGIEGLTADELHDLTMGWHRLDPWPDAVPGLTRLATRYRLGTLSNGNTALLTDLARHGGLPFHVILGAETAHAYKPLPEAYLRNVAALGLEPGQVMLCAAHNGDLAAAHEQGLRTAFVVRPTEYGPTQRTDLSPAGAWNLVCDDMGEVATALGCP
jgi:2-haloacid dehalogenase